jgi:hypothetical protein
MVNGCLCHGHAGRAALVSASGQCQWPVIGRPRAARPAGTAGLVRPAGDRIGGQDVAKVAAGADGELGEDLAQVVLDRALRNSRAPISGLDRPSRASPRDLGLLGGHLADGLDGPRAPPRLGTGTSPPPGPARDCRGCAGPACMNNLSRSKKRPLILGGCALGWDSPTTMPTAVTASFCVFAPGRRTLTS